MKIWWNQILEFFQVWVGMYENYIAYKPETEIGGSEGEKHWFNNYKY